MPMHSAYPDRFKCSQASARWSLSCSSSQESHLQEPSTGIGALLYTGVMTIAAVIKAAPKAMMAAFLLGGSPWLPHQPA